jgi:hypothetical protein
LRWSSRTFGPLLQTTEPGHSESDRYASHELN